MKADNDVDLSNGLNAVTKKSRVQLHPVMIVQLFE